jgi:hypothetical protein
MRSLYTYSFLALTFAAAAGAQIVLDPSPARVLGHPSTTPPEQLTVTNLNPNFGPTAACIRPGRSRRYQRLQPILYVADTGNNRCWPGKTPRAPL